MPVKAKKRLDQGRETIRLKPSSRKTEKTYVSWIRLPAPVYPCASRGLRLPSCPSLRLLILRVRRRAVLQ